MTSPTALENVLDVLRCPVCADGMRASERSLVCASGHTFDLARQGYVNLSSGRGGPGTGDTAAMVAARVEFFGRGHFDPVTDAVVAAAGTSGAVLDVAGGPGHHLAAILDAAPEARGICLDLSSAALRRAARAHPRVAAIGADAWQPLPIRDASVGVALSVFGPRNVPELIRVLRPGGHVIVASPAATHLAELIVPMRMLAVDAEKAPRQAAAFAKLTLVTRERSTYCRIMTRADVAAAVGMGPAAAHRAPADIAADAARLPEQTEVTVSVDVTVYRPA